MSIHERIKGGRLKLQMTEQQFADRLDVSRGTVQQWEKEGGTAPARKRQDAVAKLLGITVAELMHESLAGNTTPVTVKKRIPLISWVRAGQWSDVQDNFHPGEADDWADAYDTQPGDSSFALRVTGDSMTSPYPGDRSFPDGTIIIVDPGRASNAGDYVVAKDVDTQQATFKRLVHDGGRWFLKPLNPSYPTQAIDDPAIRVIGRVIEFQTRGKL